MKQVLLNLSNGRVELAESPWPAVKPSHLVIKTQASLISAGTERMLVNFGKAGLIEKARQQPDKVRHVIHKVKTDGLIPAFEAVRDKLNKPIPLGYCNAGVVLEVGDGVRAFEVGDFVVSNGTHAEVVCVPANLCAKIPRAFFEFFNDETNAFALAAFTVLGGVALQGIRLAQPTVGATFAVTGLGLVGQMAVQILRANGCNVLGIDLNAQRVKLAERAGARGVNLSKGEDSVEAAMELTAGRGVDGVLLTAATESSEPVHQAAQMCRKRGCIILVGVTGLELSRDDFYEKELTLQVSCSYGPGRYDPAYEEKGHDYPYGFVRWTAQRNFEAVLDLMTQRKLDVEPLISRKVPLDQAPMVYKELAEGRAGMGIILTYTQDETQPQRTVRLRERRSQPTPPTEPVIAVIGAGSFATRTMLPLLWKSKARCKLIAGRSGSDASIAGRKFRFEEATSDSERVFDDAEINTVFILTPHDSHAGLVCRALEAGKNVFVEKPLAITPAQLEQVISTYESAIKDREAPPLLHVGFNRRFAPYVKKMRELLATQAGPISLAMMVNAGRINSDHWIQDPDVGGGRIIGEACHFVDLLRFLARARITDVKSTTLAEAAQEGVPSENMTITLHFANGSVGTVHYWANGNKAYPKERLEVFVGGKILVLDNFRKLKGYGWPGFRATKSWLCQDKGHGSEVREFMNRMRTGGPSLIPFEELTEVTEACFKAAGKL